MHSILAKRKGQWCKKESEVDFSTEGIIYPTTGKRNEEKRNLTVSEISSSQHISCLDKHSVQSFSDVS